MLMNKDTQTDWTMTINNKERELYRIVDNVVRCCATEIEEGKMSITKEDVLGRSRAENLVMTRCVLAAQIVHAGYSVTTAAQLMRRTVAAVRNMLKMDRCYYDTSRAYRIASAEATLLCKGVEPGGV